MDLKDMREKKGLSQKELADLIGVSARTIARYESGSVKPDAGKMKLLEGVLEPGRTGDRSAGEEKKIKVCPYRTKTGKTGGVTFSRCLGEKCMGYVDGVCALAQRDKGREENWFEA